MCVLLITRLLRLVGKWARKPVNHTSWVALVTPTDRPKSVHNRCLIELFCSVVYVVTCPFDNSIGVGAFVIGQGQISSFLSSTFSTCKFVSPSKMFSLIPLTSNFGFVFLSLLISALGLPITVVDFRPSNSTFGSFPDLCYHSLVWDLHFGSLRDCTHFPYDLNFASSLGSYCQVVYFPDLHYSNFGISGESYCSYGMGVPVPSGLDLIWKIPVSFSLGYRSLFCLVCSIISLKHFP